MANTKIPIELSSTPSIVDGGNATAITIDSSENVTFAGTITGTLATAAQPNITSLGTLTGLTTTGDINLGDNDKAIFGASSDLQIYHDGSNSYIDDVVGGGTGDLYIKASDAVRILTPALVVNNAANNENMITAVQDGAVFLYHNGSPKIATTSTGIDVTGTATMDGLTVDGTSNFNGTINAKNVIYLKEPTSGTANGAIFIADTQKVGIQAFGTSGHITFDTGSGVAERMRIDSSGNVGIGQTSPSTKLSITAGSANGIELDQDSDLASDSARLFFNSSSGGYSIFNTSGSLRFSSGATAGSSSGTERMRIDANGNLLVGKTSTAFGTDGVELSDSLNSDGWAMFATSDHSNTDGGTVALNRKSYDGDILRLYKDSSAVGSIGTVDGDIYVGTGDTGLFFSDANNEIRPYNTSTQNSVDAAIDLGRSASRFKNLYLSGGVYANNASGAFLWNAENAHIAFGTNNTERMRIDSSGNVGIGISPTNTFSVGASGTVTTRYTSTDTSAFSLLQFENSGSIVLSADHGDSAANSNIIFKSDGATERMRIDSSGQLFLGKTSGVSGAFFQVAGDASNQSIRMENAYGTGTAQLITNTSGQTFNAILFENSGVSGSISVTTSATAYNTSSDARLKDVTGEARGLEVINELNPVAYNWKADGKADEGLIAQEVLDIVPNAVSGSEEDMYQMDYSKLVVHLVAGMKEQQTQIEELKQQIQNLTG